MSKSKDRNIIWNKHKNNTNCGFLAIETPDDIVILKHKFRDKYLTINKKDQHNRLINGLPCSYTDNNWEKPNWFYDDFYGHNNICVGKQVWHRNNGGFTLGVGLKKINKIEHLFPEGTIFKFINNQYLEDDDLGALTLGLEYKTTKKFKGFSNDWFEFNKPSLFENFTNDKILAELVSFLRKNGFIFFFEEYSENIYENESGKFNVIGEKKWEQVLGYGHGLRIGISEFDNLYNGYSYGEKNILFEKDEYFDKWSRCAEITKPTDNSEFESILKTLLEYDG